MLRRRKLSYAATFNPPPSPRPRRVPGQLAGILAATLVTGFAILTGMAAWRLADRPLRPVEAAPVAVVTAPAITVYRGGQGWTVEGVHPPITSQMPQQWEVSKSQQAAYNARCASCHSVGR